MTDKRSSLRKAVDWVKRHRVSKGGIVVHHQTKEVTPEVTGYLIKSLYDAGEKQLAYDLTKWEISIQKPDGSFAAPGVQTSYTFDTAQVIRGFIAVYTDMPEIKPNLHKACDFMLSQIDEQGAIHTPSYDAWSLPNGKRFSDYCNLFCIWPLKKAGEILKEPKYIEAADRALRYYKTKPDLVEFKPELGTLSHIFGYMLEGLAELGEKDLVQKGLARAKAIQKSDGAIPAFPGVDWVCSTGMAQLGLAWFKIGNETEARRMLEYLESIQNPSGGFYGSYGQGGQYFPGKEISWANKFFIDLYLLVKGKNG